MQFVNFKMHPAEMGVVMLILAVWVGAVATFLHKWRRLRIVPPRQLRYKHATPKNLDAVQVQVDNLCVTDRRKQIIRRDNHKSLILSSFRTASTDLVPELSGHWRLFLLQFPRFYIFFVPGYVVKLTTLSFSVHVINSSIVWCRMNVSCVKQEANLSLG